MKRTPWNKQPWQERIFKFIQKTTSCWLWTGAKDFGYGRLKVNGKMRQAHRLMWELYYGKPDANLDVCHHCDVPACVNPAHLFLGTPSDNMRDCIRKGRKKLIPEKTIQAVRKDFTNGLRQADLVRKYNISTTHIYNIVTERRRV